MSSGKRNNKIPFNDTQIKNGSMGIVGLWIGYGIVQRFI